MKENKTYTVEIINSSRQLTLAETVNLKLSANQEPLGTLAETEPVIIDVEYYAELSIHNEKSEDKDYTNFVIADTNGSVYNTGSESFINAFGLIVDSIREASNGDLPTPFTVVARTLPSKNRQGKTFLTCELK